MKKSKQTLLKIILLIELVILILLLPGCFQKTKTIVNTTEWEFDEKFQSQPLDLTPGVYQIHVDPEFEAGSMFDVGLWGNDSNFRSLLGNQVRIGANQAFVDFEYYILPGAKGVQLYVNLPPETDVVFEELTLCKLNLGARILFVCVLTLMVLVDALIIFGQKVRSGLVPVSCQITVAGLVALMILEALPLWTDYLISGISTVPSYILRTEEIRSLTPMSKVSVLFGEGLMLLPVAMRGIGFDVTSSYKITVFLCIVIVTLFVYFAVSCTFKNFYAGLLGTVFAMLAPWNSMILYLKGDLGGFCLQGFFAAAWLGVILLVRKKRSIGVLALTGSFLLFMGTFVLVIRDITPGAFLLVMAVLSFGGALGFGFLYYKLEKKKTKEWMSWFTFFMIFVIGLVGMYRLNTIVFEAEPNYLYTIESILSENVIDGWIY